MAATLISRVAGVPGAALAGAGTTTCSNAKTPLSVWSATVRSTGFATLPSTTRTVSAAMPVAVSSAPVVLIRSEASMSSVGRPSMSRVTVASTEATTPPGRTDRVPAVTVTVTG